MPTLRLPHSDRSFDMFNGGPVHSGNALITFTRTGPHHYGDLWSSNPSIVKAHKGKDLSESLDAREFFRKGTF